MPKSDPVSVADVASEAAKKRAEAAAALEGIANSRVARGVSPEPASTKEIRQKRAQDRAERRVNDDGTVKPTVPGRDPVQVQAAIENDQRIMAEQFRRMPYPATSIGDSGLRAAAGAAEAAGIRGRTVDEDGNSVDSSIRVPVDTIDKVANAPEIKRLAEGRSKKKTVIRRFPAADGTVREERRTRAVGGLKRGVTGNNKTQRVVAVSTRVGGSEGRDSGGEGKGSQRVDPYVIANKSEKIKVTKGRELWDRNVPKSLRDKAEYEAEAQDVEGIAGEAAAAKVLERGLEGAEAEAFVQNAMNLGKKTFVDAEIMKKFPFSAGYKVDQEGVTGPRGNRTLLAGVDFSDAGRRASFNRRRTQKSPIEPAAATEAMFRTTSHQLADEETYRKLMIPDTVQPKSPGTSSRSYINIDENSENFVADGITISPSADNAMEANDPLRQRTSPDESIPAADDAQSRTADSLAAATKRVSRSVKSGEALAKAASDAASGGPKAAKSRGKDKKPQTPEEIDRQKTRVMQLINQTAGALEAAEGVGQTDRSLRASKDVPMGRSASGLPVASGVSEGNQMTPYELVKMHGLHGGRSESEIDPTELAKLHTKAQKWSKEDSSVLAQQKKVREDRKKSARAKAEAIASGGSLDDVDPDLRTDSPDDPTLPKLADRGVPVPGYKKKMLPIAYTRGQRQLDKRIAERKQSEAEQAAARANKTSWSPVTDSERAAVQRLKDAEASKLARKDDPSPAPPSTEPLRLVNRPPRYSEPRPVTASTPPVYNTPRGEPSPNPNPVDESGQFPHRVPLEQTDATRLRDPNTVGDTSTLPRVPTVKFDDEKDSAGNSTGRFRVTRGNRPQDSRQNREPMQPVNRPDLILTGNERLDNPIHVERGKAYAAAVQERSRRTAKAPMTPPEPTVTESPIRLWPSGPSQAPLRQNPINLADGTPVKVRPSAERVAAQVRVTPGTPNGMATAVEDVKRRAVITTPEERAALHQMARITSGYRTEYKKLSDGTTYTVRYGPDGKKIK